MKSMIFLKRTQSDAGSRMVTSSFVISHIGRARQNHEDNFLLNGKLLPPETQKRMGKGSFVSESAVQTGGPLVFAVSDGMGGQNAGETASFLAVEMLRRMPLEAGPLEALAGACRDYIGRIGAAVRARAQTDAELSGMGATLTVFLRSGGRAAVLHLGDSRAYRFSHGSLTRITKDHTEGQRLLDLHLLSEQELEGFAPRKNLCRYLGARGDRSEPDCRLIDGLEPGERFLLCSDGLTDAVNDQKIESILKEPFPQSDLEAAARELLNAALSGGNGDNITVMMIQVQ